MSLPPDDDTSNESFSEWACSPARTLEERYGAERLIECFTGIPVAKDANGYANYEAERLWRKERALNPAYEPDYTLEEARLAEEKLPTFKIIQSIHGEERPVRNLEFLRFCPALEDLHPGDTEVMDWTPLRFVPKLKKLWINDRTAHDLRPVGNLAELETIYLFLHSPWPDFTGWDRLSHLRELHFHGNPLAMQSIQCLPALRKADISHWLSYKVPLRSLNDLPAMPELRTLKLINTWRLDGIERSPELLNLEIYGYFDDLSPLSALKKLTHLMLSGGDYISLEPVSKMLQLLWLKVRREEPQDYSVLAGLDSLREVQVEMCPTTSVEVSALNAGLSPWSELFAVEPPRSLPLLRLLLDRKDSEPRSDLGAAPRDWGENGDMAQSEARWFAREVNRRLHRLLGKGWGKVDVRYTRHPGMEHLEISRPEDIDQLRAIVDTLRELIASTRHPWQVTLDVDSQATYHRDMDEIRDEDEDDDDEEEYNAERERQDWEYRQQRLRERREFMERKHRLRLQQESGMEIRPTDFAAPPPPEKEEEAIAGDVEDSEPEYDLGTELKVYLVVMERGCFVPESQRGMAEMLLELTAVEGEAEDYEKNDSEA